MRSALALLTLLPLFGALSAEPQVIESREVGLYSGSPMKLTYDQAMKDLTDCFEMKKGVLFNKLAFQGYSPSDAGIELNGRKSALTRVTLLISLYKYDADTYDLNVAILSRFLNNCVPGLLDHKDWFNTALAEAGPFSRKVTLYDDKVVTLTYPSKILRVLLVEIRSK